VADELLLHVKNHSKTILDIGCGNGMIAKKISWKVDRFLGVDFAKKMLEMHPKSKNIECIYGDFDNPELYEYLYMYDFDLVISSSSMQWSKDIDRLFFHISKLNFNSLAFAIFSSKTFKTLHKTADTTSPLPSAKKIIKTAQKYFDVKCYKKQYTLGFKNKKELFSYIKKTGVSGTKNKLGYKDMIKLIKDYPTNILEFEVVFIIPS